MTVLEVFLIIIGIICICISFFVSRNKMGGGTESSSESAYQGANIWTEKDEQIVRQRMEEILMEEQTQYVDEAKELMGSLCNEKIMAIDEFSSQLLEKISSNHQEVVFMYNMLNEKQKELKVLMTEKPKTALPEEKTVLSGKKEPDKVPAPKKEPEKTVKTQLNQTRVKQQLADGQMGKTDAPTGLSQVKKKKPAPNKASRPAATTVPEAVKKTESTVNKQPETEIPGNVNLQIQKMYKEGKSVLEISKALDIGQGEVKLVIALYGGRKG